MTRSQARRFGLGPLAVLILLVALAPAARAEFGIAPGSFLAKTHGTVPLQHVAGAFPVNQRQVDIEAIAAVLSLTQAGAHPDATASFGFVESDPGESDDNPKDVEVSLPAGFVGDPEAVPACARADFAGAFSPGSTGSCSPVSQVGVATVALNQGGGGTYPVYRIAATTGSPASFGIPVFGIAGIVLNPRLRSDGDYGLTVETSDINGQPYGLRASSLTFWGVPADPSHDSERWLGGIDGDWGAGSGLTPRPFLLSGKLAGVPYCPEAAIERAESLTSPGNGALEQASPSCPAGSRVGAVSIGAGAGPNPLFVPGAAYLTGPYKGAALGLAIVTPAVAGPFDLGVVTVRAALHVDPVTAQIHVVSDPLPQILEGIPLDLRQIRVNIDRPDFTVNPTSCARMSLDGEVRGAGAAALVSNPFQVGACRGLAFKPKLRLRLSGGTKRNDNPALTATVSQAGGQANIGRVSVALPHSEFLDQAHIGTICTRVQFAADECPAASVYGHARAITPLLDEPLEGPVYLRSSSHPLPDLVAALRGQIDVELEGRIDSVRGGIRTTFSTVPDAPVSRFVLRMRGGRRGLLVNSMIICAAPHRALVRMRGQNGLAHDLAPLLKAQCAKRR